MNKYLLDTITLKDGRTVSGIVDFTTTKQIFFLDLTKEDLDYMLLVMLWKGNKPETRFSVFCAIEYPQIKLPVALLIPYNNVKSINQDLPEFHKPKQRKRIIKNVSIQTS